MIFVTLKPEPEDSSEVRKRRPRLRRVTAVIVVAFVGFCIWMLFFPHVDKTDGPVSLSEAGGCPIPLPPSARNVQYLSSFHCVEFADYVRFEAPVADCLSHVEVVLDHWRQSPCGENSGIPGSWHVRRFLLRRTQDQEGPDHRRRQRRSTDPD